MDNANTKSTRKDKLLIGACITAYVVIIGFLWETEREAEQRAERARKMREFNETEANRLIGIIEGYLHSSEYALHLIGRRPDVDSAELNRRKDVLAQTIDDLDRLRYHLTGWSLLDAMRAIVAGKSLLYEYGLMCEGNFEASQA